MGGRGASSGGANAKAFRNVDSNVKSLLGNKQKPLTPEEALKTTNPHFDSGAKKWRINCQRVVYAYEAQRRGYHVEAQPNVEKTLIGYRNMFDGQTWEGNLGSRVKSVKQSIESKMSNWGNGSRAIVYVVWKGGRKAHVFNVEESNGKTVAYDAQSGRKVSLANYLSMAMPSKTEISRVDHLTNINSANWAKTVMPYGDYRD